MATHEIASVDRQDMVELINHLRQKYAETTSPPHDINEAETRLLLVDTVLKSLGWSPDDFKPEQMVGKQSYTDYLLSIDNSPRLIVEAKRIGHTFGSPRKKSHRNHYTLKYLRSAFGPALSEVIKQAENYATETRVPFAVITNGAEWILVRLLPLPGRDDVEDLYGVYFGNLLSDQFNLELFWELLFREHVEGGVLETYFAQKNLEEADYCVEPRTKYGALTWQTGVTQEDIREFYDLFFDEIIDPGRREMLQRCFVSNARLDQYQGELQRTLKDTTPSYIEGAVDITPDPEKSEKLLAPDSGDQKGRVVIVTGSVGCGKSTFVTKVLIKARSENERLMPVIIDLIDEVTAATSQIAQVLWEYLDREWRKNVPESYVYGELTRIFGREISQLKRGHLAKLFEEDRREYNRREADLLDKSIADPETFFRACWRYYRSKGKGVVIFFDNVDRASEDYQKHAYAFAHKLAREAGVTVIITMRELTFFTGKEAGFLDIRSDDIVLHLQSPNLMQLLSKRIRYIQEHLDKDYRINRLRQREDWDEFRRKSDEHALTLKRSFLSSKQGIEAIGLLDAVAWHDVRYFLQMLRGIHSLLGSEGRPWMIPEIIAAIMTPQVRGDSTPIIANIFRPSYPTYQNYFLKVRLLLLLIYGQQPHETRRGAPYNKLITYLGYYGYQIQWCKTAIQELVRERLLECVEAPSAEDYTKTYTVKTSHTFRPSPLAIVLFERILCYPVYLCLISNSLPFHQPKMVEKIGIALVELYDALNERKLERDAISLLGDTALGEVVANYLVNQYSNELPPQNLVRYIPELQATETRLDNIIEGLKKTVNSNYSVTPIHTANGISQLPLPWFQDADYPSTSDAPEIPIPENISQPFGRSEQAPLIFWALVALKKMGHETTQGVEITEIINNHLVDEHHKKAPNNISRALRSDLLQSQPWLVTTVISPRKKVFGLADDWSDYWVQFFGEPAPEI